MAASDSSQSHSMVQSSALREWKRNWPLVIAAAFGFSFFSILMAAVGLFMGPLEDEFGWSRTLLSAGPSTATIMTAILGPFFGVMIDRYGARRLALPGLVLTTASIAAFALINAEVWQWLALWFIFGIVSVSIKSTIWTTAVVGVFKESRGLALGLTLSGTAVAQAVVPPLANYLIAEVGWRAAFVWLAVGWGGITFLLCALFFFDAKTRAVAELKNNSSLVSEEDIEQSGLTKMEALRDKALLRIAISNFIVMALTMGLTIHLFPILTGVGVERSYAAWLLSLSGIAAIAGKLVTGFLLDRYRPNLVGGLTLGAASLVFAMLIEGITSPALIVSALIINGYAAGTKTHITSYLTAGYAGMRNFGAIYGFMSSLMTLAFGVGPLLAGYIYDTRGDYELFLIFGAIGCAIGGALILTLPRYPDWSSDNSEN